MVGRKVDNPRWLCPEIMMDLPYNEMAGNYIFPMINFLFLLNLSSVKSNYKFKKK